MKNETLILASDFCAHHNIEITFIQSLKDSGLIDYQIVDEEIIIPQNQLTQLQKLIHFHYELEINIQGLETISHLLSKLSFMQQEIIQLQNKLRLYEHE